MKSRFFGLVFWAILGAVILSSCTGSSYDYGFEGYSPDPQIQSFTVSSRGDEDGILLSTSFTIDQINGLIYNEKTLPYKFHVDSAMVRIGSANGFQSITFKMYPDSNVVWTSVDSIDINRLTQITTVSRDGENTKTYSFKLNVYQQDPDIIKWEKIGNNLVPATVYKSNTISLKSQFITYYKNEGKVLATASDNGDGVNWEEKDVTGLPYEIRLKTLNHMDDDLIAIDNSGSVYKSSDGLSWNKLASKYIVTNIFGLLPSGSENRLLVVVKDNGKDFFAITKDFSEFRVLNEFDDSLLPIDGFSCSTIASSTSYAVRYIVAIGGDMRDGSANEDIFMLEEKDNRIAILKAKRPNGFNVHKSSLFFYDNKPYMLAYSGGTNVIAFSNNNGLDWKVTEENQALPSNFSFRTNASVLTDNNNNIWIFGGVSNDMRTLSEVWKGRLNKFDEN
ncbi:MAG: DUF6242 domain-containing protein [Fermentimonas sp.]|jgi:hypothetical protein